MSAANKVKAGQAYIEIALDQTKLERGLRKAQAKLKAFGDACTSLGTKMLGIATAAATPFAIATKTFADFDDAMRSVKAVTGATNAEFQSMTDTAERLGRETSYTAKQVAEGMASLGRMGFKSDEINAAIGDVLNLARATGTDLGAAAEIAANNMRVFGMQASQVGGMADILSATANGSAQTLTDLAEALKMAGPQAAAAGDSFTNVSGALGVLANMGIKGSLAGTALRKAYSQFAKVNVQKKLEGMGIKTVDKNGNLRAMPEIMADIAKQMNSMPTAQRLNFAEEIFDLRGSLAGLQLGGNITQLNQFIASLKNCGGAARKTAEDMDGGIGGAFRRIMSAAEGVLIQIGRIVSEAIQPYVERMSRMLTGLAEWVKAHKNIIITTVKIIGIVAALGASLVALGVAFKAIAFTVGTLNTLFLVMKTVVLAPIFAIKALIGAYHLLTAAMALCKTVAIATWTAISAPAVGVGIALAAIVAVVWKLTGAWDIMADAMGAFGADVAKALGNIKAIMGDTWNAIKQCLSVGDLAGAAKVGWAALKVVWLQGIMPLKNAWIDLKNWMADAWTLTVYGLLKTANNLWYGLLTGLTHIGDAIADAWSGIWDGICGRFADTCRWLEKKWVQLKGVFDSADEIQAAFDEIDKKYDQAAEERNQKFAETVNGRANRRKELSKEWDNSNSSIDQAMYQEMNENKGNYDDQRQQAADALNKATEEWRQAIADTKKKQQETPVTIAEKKIQETPKAIEQKAKKTGTAVDMSGKTAGSYSAKALGRLLGGSTAAERTARATERSERQLQELNKKYDKQAANAGMAAMAYGA